MGGSKNSRNGTKKGRDAFDSPIEALNYVVGAEGRWERPAVLPAALAGRFRSHSRQRALENQPKHVTVPPEIQLECLWWEYPPRLEPVRTSREENPVSKTS